jgi:DNA-binding NarL/FixJ family response regulator
VNSELTRREEQIVELVAEGLLNREVAQRIGLTKYTVKNYLRTIYDKSGFGNRVQLALWCVRYREKRKVENDNEI